jgi:Kdo2-lipid IVA lauroyltransferase/acyltransferase
MQLKISSFFQSPANVLLFRGMSPRVAQLYLHVIGLLYYMVSRKEKRLIERNIRDVLQGQDERYVRKVIRATFRGIFTHYFEKMFAAYRNLDTVLSYVATNFKVEGAQLLDRALEQGKGCILVTAHWGAVEFIPWLMHTLRAPTSAILECATARLEKTLRERVSHGDITLITSSAGESVYAQAMQALKSNRVLLTQCDEVDAWRRRKSQTISLFGRELFFDSTIDILSHRSDAPVVGAFLRRSGRHRYTLILEDVSVLRTPESRARECLALWEKYVSRYPEQWYQWKKWRAMKVTAA